MPHLLSTYCGRLSRGTHISDKLPSSSICDHNLPTSGKNKGAVTRDSFSRILYWDSKLATFHEKPGGILSEIPTVSMLAIFSRDQQVVAKRRERKSVDCSISLPLLCVTMPCLPQWV